MRVKLNLSIQIKGYNDRDVEIGGTKNEDSGQDSQREG